MKIRVHPSHSLKGDVTLPGDKSISHRAALFSALAEGESLVENFQVSGVTRVMLSALERLGVETSLDGDRLRVVGRGWQNLNPPGEPIDCGNSATTLRLLTGALAASGLPAVLDGSAGLRQRPMCRIIEPLQQMGVPIAGTALGTAPIELTARSSGSKLRGMEIQIPVASAQVKSCLLLAGLAANRPLVIHEPALSRDHTERMLIGMGCHVETYARCTVIFNPPTHALKPLRFIIPGDLSSAAFLVVAALIVPGSKLVIKNVGLNPTRTGILEALISMGADLQVEINGEQAGEPYGNLTVHFSQLNGITVSGDLVVRMIDEFPIFAIAACCADGITEVRDAAELRAKESDRITTLCQELSSIGAIITETADGFRIQGPCSLNGGATSSHRDHRLAMALAVAGLVAGSPVVVDGAEIIQESFPGFINILRSMGAEVEMESDVR